MKNGLYFIVVAFLFAKLFKIFGLCKLDDLWRDTLWTQTDVEQQNKIMEYLCKY